VFTKLTSVTRKFGFYTGSADHVPKENVNKSVLPGYINQGRVNTLFLSIQKHLNIKTSALSWIPYGVDTGHFPLRLFFLICLPMYY